MTDASTETASAPKKGKAKPKAKVNLTDRFLKGKTLKPEKQPYEVMDTEVRGLGIRVMPTGVKTFILRRRYPGSTQSARRSLGTYGEMSLAQAREKARDWNALVKKGIDPAIEEKRQRQTTIEAETKRQSSTFGAAFEDFLQRKASMLKSGRDIEREMRRECKSWMTLPLADISPSMIKEVAQGMVARGTSGANARFWFANTRAFFNWVIDTGDFNLEVSPCDKLKPTVLIGPPKTRDRVLKDFEIAACWRASEAINYPFGKLIQLLFLTALRRDEASEAQWREIDFDAGLWLIPAARMKNGAPHAVPLVPDIIALLQSLPRFAGGDYLFSTKSGQKPVSGFTKAKKRLDKLMRMDLEAQRLPIEHFVIHDIRRTCRTRFSALADVEETVRELLLAHARPGLHKVYDQHAYEKEKAHALKLWHEKLKNIVGGNLVL